MEMLQISVAGKPQKHWYIDTDKSFCFQGVD